ncbi:MAG: hypothetical protein JW700_00325 [Candidatus Aenigmarchaeota archaeon]|nr:hypothetical protein [Candidatus Aenigmarchaeota archaeon]
MKGVSVIVASTIVIVISITVVYMALQMSGPAFDRSNEILNMENAKRNLVRINNAVSTVLSEGEGSTRTLDISVQGGYYTVDGENEKIMFTMDTFSQIVAANVSKIEDSINITADQGRIYLSLDLSSYNVTGSSEFGDGTYSMVIRNVGYDSLNQKQMLLVQV